MVERERTKAPSDRVSHGTRLLAPGSWHPPPRARWPGTLGSWLAGHCPWVLHWAGACYWHGVGGFMFNSSSSGPWLFSTAEARTSNSSSSSKPGVDPPPSKTAGGCRAASRRLASSPGLSAKIVTAKWVPLVAFSSRWAGAVGSGLGAGSREVESETKKMRQEADAGGNAAREGGRDACAGRGARSVVVWHLKVPI